MGIGSRVGNDKQNTGYFDASKITVDGSAIALDTPIFVDGQKSKLVSVDFDINGFNAKIFNTIVMCPALNMLDKAGVAWLAICRGYVLHGTPTRFQEVVVHPLWRILPRGTETSSTE